ncbi:MAG: diaminopimelate epimerase [Candidatus Binatia bacterium]
MELQFAKLHGCENDYLYVDCRERPLENAPEVARLVSDRRAGVGSDGLICVYRCDSADFRMEMFNADGSRGAMCGNGIRGLGKYVFDRGMTDSDRLSVATDSGVKTLRLHHDKGLVHSVTVDMGEAILEASAIPAEGDGPLIDIPLEVDGRSWTVTCVSMGNPHCVTFDEDPDGLDLERTGPGFASLPFFPAGVNTEFVRVDSPSRLTMRVWERGSGETMACGSGACAAVVAAALSGRAERRATVCLRGGELEIDYLDDGRVMMTGPTVEVFSGTMIVPQGGSDV